MKTRKKWLALALAASMGILALTGCTGTEPPEEPAPSSGQEAPASSEAASSEPEKAPVRNPLTGEEGYSEALLTRRPVAIMINNIKASLPQRGIAEADIIYELPVEGAITRLMAVYSDPARIPEVGSIRSARHDFVELAKPLNAIYVHFGGSDSGFSSLRENRVDYLNGIELSKTAFHFDGERHKTKATEHCWYTNGGLIAAGIAEKGYAPDAEQPIPPAFHFIRETDQTPSSETSREVKAATAPLSREVTATFRYEEEQGAYIKGMNGNGQVDENSGAAASVKNVFLLYPKVGYLEDGLHKEVALESGEGWYLSNGRGEKITFEKKSPDSLLSFSYAKGARTGQALDVNPGKSWVCVAPSDYAAKLSLE